MKHISPYFFPAHEGRWDCYRLPSNIQGSQLLQNTQDSPGGCLKVLHTCTLLSLSGGLHGDPPVSILFCTQDMARQLPLQIYRTNCSYGVDGRCFILQSEDVLQGTSQVFLCLAAFHGFLSVFYLLFSGCIIAAPAELTRLCSTNCFPGKRN